MPSSGESRVQDGAAIGCALAFLAYTWPALPVVFVLKLLGDALSQLGLVLPSVLMFLFTIGVAIIYLSLASVLRSDYLQTAFAGGVLLVFVVAVIAVLSTTVQGYPSELFLDNPEYDIYDEHVAAEYLGDEFRQDEVDRELRVRYYREHYQEHGLPYRKGK